MVNVLGFLLICPQVTRGDYALRDGDTVVFLGDSITAARTYGKIIENYTLLRFPGRKVRFVNAGWGGDTAAGGLKRLDRDVFGREATVLIVVYGVNDIGWGTKADAQHKQIYLDSIRGIVERCKSRGVRVFVGSAAVTAEKPDSAEHGFLQSMCDEGMAIARSLGEHSIDIQRAMRAIQRNVLSAELPSKSESRPKLHAADGIHLNELGQLAMAFAILKGLGAPADVSSATIDANRPKVVQAVGCHLTNVRSFKEGSSSRLEFDRLDDGLPVNFGLFGALQFRFVPIPDQLNRYMLTVSSLPPDRYEVRADGRSLGSFTEKQLSQGLNVSSVTADGWEPGGPWDAEAGVLISLTDARDQIAQSERYFDHFLPAHPERVALHTQSQEINRRIEALQRTLLTPRAFHFVVSPTKNK
jgi:lysophospholipase L1-like esterase